MKQDILQATALMLCVAIVACCTGPNHLQTEKSIGTVTDMRIVDAGPPGPYTVTILVFTNGIIIPIPITAQRQLKDSFIYSLRLNDNTSITTQSYSTFHSGDCVELWHERQAPMVDPKLNFIAGTLMKSNDCKGDGNAS